MKKDEVISLIHEVLGRGGIPDVIVENDHEVHVNNQNDKNNNDNQNHNYESRKSSCNRNSRINRNCDRNSEVSANGNLSGDTLLHLAVKHNLQEELLLLLDNGAPLYIKNNEGLTPERLAMKEGNQVVLQMLMRYKSHAKYVNKLGRGPNPRYNNHYSPSSNYFPRQLTHCSEQSGDSAGNSILTASDDGILGVFNDTKGTAIGTSWDLQNTSIHEEYLLWGDDERSSQLKQQLQMLAKDEKELHTQLENLQQQQVETKRALSVDILQELRNKEHSFCMHIWNRLGLEQQIREELESISNDVYHTKQAIEITQSHVFWSCRGYLRVWNGFFFTRWSPVTISIIGQQLQIKAESKYCSGLGLPLWQGCVDIPLENVRGIRLHRKAQKTRRFWRFGPSMSNFSLKGSREWRDIIISAKCDNANGMNQKNFVNFFIRVDEQEPGTGSYLTSCIHNGRWVLQSSIPSQVLPSSDNEEKKEETKLDTTTDSDKSLNCGVIQGLFMALQFCGNSLSPVYVEKVTSVHTRYFTSPKFTSNPLVRDPLNIMDDGSVGGSQSRFNNEKISDSPLTLTETRSISNERTRNHQGGLLLRDSQTVPSFDPTTLTDTHLSGYDENVDDEMGLVHDTSLLDGNGGKLQQQNEVSNDIHPIIIPPQDGDRVGDENVTDVERGRDNARRRMERDISTHMRTYSSFISSSSGINGQSTNASSERSANPTYRPTVISDATTTATYTFADSGEYHGQSYNNGITDHSNLTNMSNLSKLSDIDFAVSWKTGNSNKTDEVETEENRIMYGSANIDANVEIDIENTETNLEVGRNKEGQLTKFYPVEASDMNIQSTINKINLHTGTQGDATETVNIIHVDNVLQMPQSEHVNDEQLKLPVSKGNQPLLSKGRKKKGAANRRSMTHTEILVTVLEDYEDMTVEGSDNDNNKEEEGGEEEGVEGLEDTVGSTFTGNSISIVTHEMDEDEDAKYRPRAQTANGRFMSEAFDSDVNTGDTNKSADEIHKHKHKEETSNETIMSLSYDTGLAHHRNRTQTHPKIISAVSKGMKTDVSVDKESEERVVKSLHYSYNNKDDSLRADSQSLGSFTNASSAKENESSRASIIISPIGAPCSVDYVGDVDASSNAGSAQKGDETGIIKASNDSKSSNKNDNNIRSLFDVSTGCSDTIPLSKMYDLVGRPILWLKMRLNQQRSVRGKVHLQLMEALTKREKLLERVHYLQALKKIVVDPPSAPTRLIQPAPLPSIEKSTFAAKLMKGMELRLDRSTKHSETSLNDSINARLNGGVPSVDGVSQRNTENSLSIHADIDKDLFVEYMMKQTSNLLEKEGGRDNRLRFDHSQTSGLTDQENENDLLLDAFESHGYYHSDSHNLRNNKRNITYDDLEDKSIVQILQTPSKSRTNSMRQRRLGAPPRDLASSYELVMSTLNSLWKVEMDTYENVKRLTDTVQQRERTLNLLKIMDENSNVIDDLDSSEMYEVAF